jgi:hypothetical protein
MRKQILTECLPIQSIKVLDININQLKHELLNQEIDSDKRKLKEDQLKLMMNSRNDLQDKHEKFKKSSSKKRLPSLNSGSKNYTKQEHDDLMRLIDSD